MKTLYQLSTWMACAVLLASCASNSAIQESKVLLAEGHAEESVSTLERAMHTAPDDLELRAEYFRQRDVLTSELLVQADAQRVAHEKDAAQALYERVLKMDPNNPRAHEGEAELAAQERRAQSLQEAQKQQQAGNLVGAERLLRTLVGESPADGQDAVQRAAHTGIPRHAAQDRVRDDFAHLRAEFCLRPRRAHRHQDHALRAQHQH